MLRELRNSGTDGDLPRWKLLFSHSLSNPLSQLKGRVGTFAGDVIVWLGEEPHAVAGAPGLVDFVGRRAHRRARNVEMRPRRVVLDKTLQELRRGDDRDREEQQEGLQQRLELGRHDQVAFVLAILIVGAIGLIGVGELLQELGFDLDRTSGSTLDSFVRVFNSAGSRITSNDNRAAPGETLGKDSYVEYTFTTAGTYYVGVSGYGNSVGVPTVGGEVVFDESYSLNPLVNAFTARRNRCES